MYTGQWCLSPLQSRYLGISQFSQLLSAALSYFPESHPWSEISSLSKVVLVSGKARSHRAPNLGCRRCWITWVIWYFTKKLWTRCDVWAGTLFWWSYQSPVAHSCDLLNHLNSRGMFKFNAKFDTDSIALLTQSFWMWWLHSTCAHSKASTTPYWLVQLSHTIHECTFRSTLLGCRQVTLMSCKPFRYINNGWTFPGQITYVRIL